MSIQFSDSGPAFPEPLVDALLSGEVVFLCGAGISFPQLPGFPDLVKQCFERLNVEWTPSENNSFDSGRYEEVLGSLSRRIVEPDDLTKAIVHLLRVPAAPDLANHRTILRLSRDAENHPLIVTTNFDTLLEQALRETEEDPVVRNFSSAGQDLPAPGSATFRGIIHLHGRLAAPDIELPQTPFIVTSADYGDAYMRSGWASRFLFDLCRCKTVILVGYSAGDAPVRYFLNLLEADRRRFPELRLVYALDAVEAGNHAAAQTRWGALAVEPIPFELEVDAAGKKHYTALWRDLGRLADLAERPRLTRRLWAEDILAKPLADASAAQTDRVAWLFRGKRDLWPVAIESLHDPAWLDFFESKKLWNVADAAAVVTSWLSRDFCSASRLGTAIRWLERLGKPFATAVAARLQQTKDMPALWLRAWRLVTIAHPPGNLDWTDGAFRMAKSLQSPVLFHADLIKAVDLLTPRLELNARLSELYGTAAPAKVERLGDLMWPRLQVPDMQGAPGLLEALVAVPQPGAILAIATARLSEITRLSIDIEAIDGDYDSNDFAVPSVEPHGQNEHHDGPIFLVQLLARLLTLESSVDRDNARALAQVWRAMPGALGVRLWLHALRDTRLFSADEAMAGVEALGLSAFWAARRELPLVLRDRAGDAGAAFLGRIEQRILTQGLTYYSRFSIGDGQIDWHAHARDTGVWLRLNMLADAGRLSGEGARELAAIKSRRDHLNRDVEDSDFFGSYSTGVRMIKGDPAPILNATAEDRLEVAREVLRSRDLEEHHGWSAYCRTDPRGAFDTLANAPLNEANAPLWEGLIGTLCFPEDAHEPLRCELVQHIFDALRPAGEPVMAIIARSLADLYVSAPRIECPSVGVWWPRLFACAVAQDNQALDATRDLYSRAINSAGGRLTQAVLLDIQASVRAGKPSDHLWIAALETAAAASGRQGAYARAALVYASAFLVNIKAENVVRLLSDALKQDTVEAIALRSILVVDAPVSPATSRMLGRHILQGVLELGKDHHRGRDAAAKIIAPALSIVRGEHDAMHWGISLSDTASSLRNGPPALREGAALLLSNWIHQIDGGPAHAWRDAIHPLLEKVWPREQKLREAGQAVHFAELAIAAQEAFPEALKTLLPYLSPNGEALSINQLEESKAPEEFPQETLTLIWRLLGARIQPEIYGVATILDRLIKADPRIEFDRRLQSLNQRALRFM